MNTVTITLADKCKIPSNSTKAYVYGTRSGISKVFSIPISQVKSKEISGIKYNEVHTEPATKFTITTWLFLRIGPELRSMKEHHCIIDK